MKERWFCLDCNHVQDCTVEEKDGRNERTCTVCGRRMTEWDNQPVDEEIEQG